MDDETDTTRGEFYSHSGVLIDLVLLGYYKYSSINTWYANGFFDIFSSISCTDLCIIIYGK